jgi:serine/threonine-protein kinase
VSLVNPIFWEKNPSLKGHTLSNGTDDESLREEWDQIVSEVLEKLSGLSSNSCRLLETYTSAQRDCWKVEVNKVHIDSHSLSDLGDATFLKEFPEYKGEDFLTQPIRPVWDGFVCDKLKAMLSNSTF